MFKTRPSEEKERTIRQQWQMTKSLTCVPAGNEAGLNGMASWLWIQEKKRLLVRKALEKVASEQRIQS